MGAGAEDGRLSKGQLLSYASAGRSDAGRAKVTVPSRSRPGFGAMRARKFHKFQLPWGKKLRVRRRTRAEGRMDPGSSLGFGAMRAPKLRKLMARQGWVPPSRGRAPAGGTSGTSGTRSTRSTRSAWNRGGSSPGKRRSSPAIRRKRQARARLGVHSLWRSRGGRPLRQAQDRHGRFPRVGANRPVYGSGGGL
jgi:hypothetical protein